MPGPLNISLGVSPDVLFSCRVQAQTTYYKLGRPHPGPAKSRIRRRSRRRNEKESRGMSLAQVCRCLSALVTYPVLAQPSF